MNLRLIAKVGCWSSALAPRLPLLALILIVALAHKSSAQQANSSQAPLSEAEIARIVNAFTAKEAEFRKALNIYSFKRDALMQSLGMGGQITGEFHRVSFFTYDDRGNRYEKIILAPMASLEGITQEDIDDLGGINPFALEPSKISRYSFKYMGREKIDELDLYVFDVTPKVMPDPKKSKERLFMGRVWVDDKDLQIVKTRGKGVPETKNNKFPIVETYREWIDGRYWFPTYSWADEELIFDSGEPLHIRVKVTYTEFSPPHVTVRVREADDQAAAARIAATPTAPTPTVAPAPTTSAQVNRSQPIDLGALNAKAIELPDPKLPDGAPKLGGKVRVRVVVDETGKVISAEIEDGRIELRRASIEAARLARFAPTIVDGKPVKVTGIISYLFVQ
jgi:TonB family protein